MKAPPPIRLLHVSAVLGALTLRAAVVHGGEGADGYVARRCRKESVPLGLRTVKLGNRTFLLFVPKSYHSKVPIPVWILAHGSFNTATTFLNQSNMVSFAEEKHIAFVALEGEDENLNVGLHSQDTGNGPDDVEYTRQVLRRASEQICVDLDRIWCTGFSRGARFCSRLASELPSIVSGILPVSGLRFPQPNNRTRARPLPIIAFHGTKDPINPYWGKGNPKYWISSVPDAMQRWGDFNGCQRQRWEKRTFNVSLSRYSECKDSANVELILVTGGGHTWPGSHHSFERKHFGYTTHEVDANQLMWKFFVEHARVQNCHTAREGEPCHAAVKRLMRHSTGAEVAARHPEWGDQLKGLSGFEELQTFLFEHLSADCSRPCRGTREAPRKSAEAPSLRHSTKTSSPAWDIDFQAQEATANAGSAVRLNGDTKKEALEAIQGAWTHQNRPGNFVEVFKGESLHWDGGPKAEIVVEGADLYSMRWHGILFHARLKHGKLVWDDGDVWVRLRPGDETPVAARLLYAPFHMHVAMEKLQDMRSVWQHLVSAGVQRFLTLGGLALVVAGLFVVARRPKLLQGSWSPLSLDSNQGEPYREVAGEAESWERDDATTECSGDAGEEARLVPLQGRTLSRSIRAF